jgi:ubiquinone biosynthesis O-methyltransferase
MSTGDLVKDKSKSFLNYFDIVIASEVIEHVSDRNTFLSDISSLCRSGGLIVLTTINKSLIGIALAKYFAENILTIVPEGTHDPKKFISPKQLALEAEKHNIILDNFTGFFPTFNIKNLRKKEFGDFILVPNLEVNYGAAGIKI